MRELHVAPGAPVEVKVAHKLAQEYKASTSVGPQALFKGEAQTLEADGTGSAGHSKPPAAAEAIPTSSSHDMPTLDTNAPMQVHQLRLSSGARTSIRVNQNATTNAELYAFVSQSIANDPHVLIMQGHPPNELPNDSSLLSDSLPKPTLLTIKKKT